MTTDNQNISEESKDAYSKASSIGKNFPAKPVDKTASLKTLSLRPTRSVKKNNSIKPAGLRRVK